MIRFPTRLFVGFPVAFSLAAILAIASAPLKAADEPMVKIENFAFTPAVLTVKPGTVVTFQNDDDIPHLVVANDGSFRSKALDTGDTYALTFTKAGDYAYFCGLHPHMQGRITVAP
ncbi:cupredoxin family copper-binding protein [Mesorhizobium sp. M0622]|uniref:cupredoxin domain-containing protein n=1 Tax=unclassified Mesorhizobium TaxID=325217 RepID=UPI003338881C